MTEQDKPSLSSPEKVAAQILAGDHYQVMDPTPLGQSHVELWRNNFSIYFNQYKGRRKRAQLLEHLSLQDPISVAVLFIDEVLAPYSQRLSETEKRNILSRSLQHSISWNRAALKKPSVRDKERYERDLARYIKALDNLTGEHIAEEIE